jgi:alkanesulfonate monooxygenase SsuD/methylene tetrahydromethanopterin reductase-like flavin-dependent oxidoreductase (luciferase family)
MLADRLSYAEAFIGEHLTDAGEPITSSLAFIASIADRCASLTFGTGVLSLLNYHPVIIAAQTAMIDHLLDGRFVLGVGAGVPSDAEALDNLQVDRDGKVVEGVDQIIALWSGEAPYNLDGKFHQITTESTLTREIGQGMIVRPLQKPHPPIVFSCVRPNSPWPEVAGRRNWAGISASYISLEWVRAHISAYIQAKEDSGFDPDAADWRVARSIFVTDDEATARSYAMTENGPYSFYFFNVMTKLASMSAPSDQQPVPPIRATDVAEMVRKRVIAGTVDQVVRQILELRSIVGPFGTLLYTGHDWIDPPLARRSMELMAEEVMPRVNAALQQPQSPPRKE